MAPRPETRLQDRVNVVFMTALLFSLGLHMLVLAVLPAIPEDQVKTPVPLSVELQPPPQPLPPPEPPKPPAPEKPKQPPKKPLPPPKPQPEPPRMEAPADEAEPPEPPPPPVISAPPQAAEPPPTVVVPVPPPEPPKPRVPSEQDLDNARSNYSNLLSREFARHKQYPRLAQMRGWQGTAKVELHVDANGNMISISVNASSGFEILDKQALEMVRKASPLPQPPEALRGREFTIIVPVAFRLE